MYFLHEMKKKDAKFYEKGFKTMLATLNRNFTWESTKGWPKAHFLLSLIQECIEVFLASME